jgi:hypothetical protein
MIKKDLFTHRYHQKGLALLITLSLLSILIILVFSMSHQGTLDAQWLNQKIKHLKQKQIWISAQHAITAYIEQLELQQNNLSEQMSFSIGDHDISFSIYNTGEAFNINQLKERKKQTDALYTKALKQSRLNSQRQHIIDIVNKSNGPILDCSQLYPLCSEKEKGSPLAHPYATQNFSCLPPQSLIVQATINQTLEHTRSFDSTQWNDSMDELSEKLTLIFIFDHEHDIYKLQHKRHVQP